MNVFGEQFGLKMKILNGVCLLHVRDIKQRNSSSPLRPPCGRSTPEGRRLKITRKRSVQGLRNRGIFTDTAHLTGKENIERMYGQFSVFVFFFTSVDPGGWGGVLF